MLRAAWPGDGMLADVVQELAARVPGAECIAAYTRTADGGLGVCGQTAVRPYDSWKNWRGATDIPEHARYPLDRRDPWALTPVAVHANPPARARCPTAPEWLRTAPRCPRDVRHLATVHPVPVDGVPLFLVLARESTGMDPGLTSLPPSLARVGHLMARGLSDKEIAAELDLPLATARTYAQRVLRRLRLRDRRELMLQ